MARPFSKNFQICGFLSWLLTTLSSLRAIKKIMCAKNEDQRTYNLVSELRPWAKFLVVFYGFLMFGFHLLYFFSSMTEPPKCKNQITALGKINGPRQCFRLICTVSYDFEYTCFNKNVFLLFYSAIICLISPPPSVMSAKTAHNPLQLNWKILFITAWCLAKDFLLLILQVL